MKSLTKLPLALSLALFGAASSISALAMATEPTKELHEVMVEVSGDENVSITVEINGAVTDLVIPKDALHDKETLAQALSDVPEEVREQLLAELGNIHFGDKMIKVHKFDGEGDMNWVSKDGERIVIIESDSGDHDVDIKKVVRKMKHHIGDENTIFIKHSGKMNAEMVLRLIKDADLSSEDLDNIQQAIDAKR